MKLLIIDTQELYVNNKLYNFELLKKSIKELIDTARRRNVEVIYVRHDDGEGTLCTRGKPCFEIFSEFAPLPNERIFDKTVNSPFKNSGLLEYLREQGETTLMVAGVQTEYCIDATVKAGFEHGFNIIVPNDCNSTTDNFYLSAELTYRYFNEFIWKNRYAKCIPFDTALRILG